ncbi:MAG: RHS repeat-associated core domain-containing protein, partial [Paludibacteraceae bacterium]|nr:RHS repeat-associated core domain-containing protein [Paludibacteraceae bacterium]
ATLESAYTYDPLGQLISFTRSDGQSESYVYDPAGNMTAKTKNGVKTAMRYNAANQLISSVTGTDKTTYRYDANGNLVKSENAGGARSYTYNALGLLAQFTREDGYTEDYTYNANRLLSGVTNKDGTTALTYDILYGDGVVISENHSGEQTTYTYGLERISAITGKTRTEYVYDGRGSVAAEVTYNNAWYTFGGGLAKKETVSKSYSPFGELLTENVSGFGYNGEYYNAATGMIYLRARFYAPEMNRFSQKDILRGSAFVPQSLNRYLYVQNDPINFVDSSGESLKTLRDSARSLVGNVVVTATAAVAVAKNTVNQVVKQTVATVSTARTAVSASISAAKSNVINTAANSIRAGNGVATTVNNVITSVKNEVQTVKNGVAVAKASIVTGAKSAKNTVEAGITFEKKIAQTMLPQIADSGAHLLNQLGLVFANGLLKYEDTINWKELGDLVEFADDWMSLPDSIVEGLPSHEIIDGNFEYNQENDIQNQIINNQNTGPVGNLYIGYPGTKGFIGENYPRAIDTGCGIIAVNNIMQFLGMDSSMAQLIRQFQEMDAITTAPVVAKYGEIGSNPYSYPDVLSANGISATKVKTIDKMSEKGAYLFTFWNSSQGTNNQASVINGLHTVAATFDGSEYVVYNLYGNNREYHFSTDKFVEEFEDGFAVGYRVDNGGTR